MLRSLVVLLCCIAVLGVRAQAEPLPTRFLDKGQIAQLHEATCADAVREHVNDGERSLTCTPRNYPWPDEFRCAFTYKTNNDGRYDISYGRFTASHLQAIAMYEGACEPHATSYGGMVLLDVIDGEFKLARYYRGHVYTGCVTVPTRQEEERDVPFCQSSFSQNGETYEAFGPIRFAASGEADFNEWFHAEDDDNAWGAVDNCDGETKAHHLTNLRFAQDTNTIVLEAAMRDPKVVAEACRRYLAEEFNDEDRQRREDNPVLLNYGLIRSNEADAFVKMVVRFNPTDYVPRAVEVTGEPAPPVSP
jgi:hypothetical protein